MKTITQNSKVREGTAFPFSQRQLIAALEAAANGVMLTSSGGTILWVNPAITKMTGYEPEELIGWTPSILKSGKQSSDFYRQIWQTITSGTVWHGTVCNRRKDGSEYWEDMTITPVWDSQGQITTYIAIKQDITERRQLEEQRTRLTCVLEATPDFVGIADAAYRPLFVNLAGKKLLGIGDTTFLSDIRECHPDWATKMVLNEGIPAAVRTGAWSGETALLSRDGREIPVSQVIVAHKDATGDVRFFSTIMRDLTETRKLERQLQQSQKLEAVGQLAGGVAHDFNNMLTIILGYSDLLLDSLNERDPLRESVLAIDEAATRAARLTRQLLAFSRRQVLQFEVLDINAVVAGIREMAQRLIGEDITLTVSLQPDLRRVRADSAQLEQVIMNLAVNARDAMPRGGSLTIETRNVGLDADYAAQYNSEVRPGEYVLLAVSDTGHGMDKATLAHIFEPFFTTKEPGKGTGLGLAMAFGIVRQSGGHIAAYSEPGLGATFKIYLPIVAEDSHVPSPTTNKRTVTAGTETILLVEDEDAVRNLARLILTRQGYTVLEARNGGEALLLWERHGEEVDLLVTDVVMPHMSGRQVADRLRALRPSIRVLFLSGYTDDAVIRHGVIDAGVPFLQKPFKADSLAQKVREALDR